MKVLHLDIAVFNRDESDVTDEQHDQLTDHIIDYLDDRGMAYGGLSRIVDEVEYLESAESTEGS